MKKKVLYSIYNSKKIGGPNNAMRRMANSFLSEKYEFIPLVLDDHLGKILRIPVLRRIIKEIKEKKPDVIYFTGMQLQGFYMAVACWLAGYRKKSIMVVRGSVCDAIDISGLNRFLFRWFIEPISVRLTGTTHTVCTEMANNPIVKDNVRNFGGVIYNAAPDVSGKLHPHEDFREEINAQPDEVLLVFTGRLHSDKGISYLIEALEGTDERIKLVLVGGGPHEEQFKEQAEKLNISDRVIFLGDRNDVIRILCGCDAFVFPTLHENLSNSVLEACAVGIPIVATEIGGNPEIIRDGVEGYLVPARDVDALRKAIITVSQNKELRMQLGKNAVERVNTVFSAKTIYTKLDKLFESV